jgi:hypothetical protein
MNIGGLLENSRAGSLGLSLENATLHLGYHLSNYRMTN